MDSSALFLALLRGAHVAAVLSLFGTVVFGLAIAPAARAGGSQAAVATDRHLAHLARISAGLALLLGAAWFAAETAAIGGVRSLPAVVALLPAVALHTQLGHWLAARLALLLAVLLLPGRSLPGRSLPDRLLPGRSSLGGLAVRWVAVLTAAAAVAVQPMFGHAGAAEGGAGTMLIAAEEVHLLAAGAWLGALLPLWVVIRRLPAPQAARACARFSWLGLTAAGLIVATALVLAVALVGSIPALVGTGYGRLLLLKSGLLLLALALACRNRYVLTGRLAVARAGARAALLRSVGIEAAIGLAIVLAAAFLAAQMPGVDHPAHAHLAGWLDASGAHRCPAASGLAGVGAAGVGLAAGLP